VNKKNQVSVKSIIAESIEQSECGEENSSVIEFTIETDGTTTTSSK
jgi:hypothetical protein